MNTLEQMAQMANKGELAEPLRAVEYVNNVAIVTENYTKTGPGKGEDGLNPPVVDAADIREAMAKSYRPTVNYSAEEYTDMPYFTKQDEENMEAGSEK